MIRPTSAHSNGDRIAPRIGRAPASRVARGHRRRRAFTLVELLVVIGIIILLVGLLSPMVARSYRNAERARVASDLQAIGSALEAYKQDHGAYPDPGMLPPADPTSTGNPEGYRGANRLCLALLSPLPDIISGGGGDGANGGGFRVRPGGKVWQPYLNAGQFRIGRLDGQPITTFDSTNYRMVFVLDRFRKPILYYRANVNADTRVANGFATVVRGSTSTFRPLYDPGQNVRLLDELRMRIMLGDTGSNPANLSGNGMIDGQEAAVYNGPYILWSPGPDELYGPQAGDAGTATALDKPDLPACDDITNFRN